MDNQGTKEDDSMSDPHPEAGLFRSQTTQNSGQEVGPYSVDENRCCLVDRTKYLCEKHNIKRMLPVKCENQLFSFSKIC